MGWRRVLSLCLSLCLLLGLSLGPVGAPGSAVVRAAGGSRWAAFGARQSAAARLLASTPPEYAQRSAAAEAYLVGLVTTGGIGALPAAAQAWISAALDLSGDAGPAGRVLSDLLAQQRPDGSWRNGVGATGLALWALGEHARLTRSAGYLRAHWRAIAGGAAFLLAHQAGPSGDIGSLPGGPYPATAMGEAVLGLRSAAAAALVLGRPAAAAVWGRAASHAAAALRGDVGIARAGATDYFANALFDPGTGSLLQRREVAGAPALSLTYPGWGVKLGPGYYNGQDWVGAEPTFLYVLAAVWNGLPAQGAIQYDGGLRLQCAGGEVAYQYHPPVGPQTGGFEAGPNCADPRTSPEFTAMYLLATHALLGIRAAPGGGVHASPHLPAPWRSASVAAGGQVLTLTQAPAVDPVVPFHRRRIAVVVGTANGNESGLGMGVAYEALVSGYVPWTFWYLNNDYGPLHNLYNLFHHLARYRVIVLGHNALHGPVTGAYAGSGAAHPSPTPRQWFQAQGGALSAWVRAGGRLLGTGDRVALPLPAALAATEVVAPTAAVRPTGAGVALAPRGGSLAPGAVGYYRAVGDGYAVLATAQVDGVPRPVLLRARAGAGVVLQTTIGVSAARGNLGPLFRRLLAATLAGLPATPAPRRQMRRLAVGAGAAISGDWWDAATGSFTAPPGTQDRCGSGIAALFAVGQVYAAANALRSPRLGAEVGATLPRYWSPGYGGTGAYLACPGGRRAYYDDNGWLLGDLLVRYAQAPAPGLLAQGERLFRFLETGWRAGVGGERFYPGCQCAEQVATGMFLDAALRLYLITHRPSYLAWAQTIYAWERKHMEAGPRGNGLYYDFIQGGGDQVTGFQQYTYDTGVVVQAEALLYQATGDRAYLRAGARLAAAASAAFVDPADGAMLPAGASGPAFNAIYLQGARMLASEDGHPAWLQIGRTSARAAVLWDARAGAVGATYGQNWGGVNPAYGPAHLDVLTQAGTTQLFSLLAPSRSGRARPPTAP